MVQDVGAGASVVMTTNGAMVQFKSGVRDRLAIGSANEILQVKSSLPSWETISFPDSVLTTQGDTLYEGASGLARLAAGTSGYFLKTQGASANPVWAEVAGGASASDNITVDGVTLTLGEWLELGI